MQQYWKRSHTLPDIKYCCVWITKFWHKILKGDLGIRVRDIILEVCMACDCKILKGSVGVVYVHLLVAVLPRLAPSKLTKYKKGKSSHMVQQELLDLRKRYWAQHIWARGYFCASTGAIIDELILKYMEDQGRQQPQDVQGLTGAPLGIKRL